MQDFSKKAVIAVRRDLEPWQVLNTVAHIAGYLCNKVGADFDTGEFFISKGGLEHPRNSQYAIVVVEAKKEELLALSREARARKLLHLDFVRDMVDTTNDAELENWISQKEEKDLDYFGVGVFGDKEVLKELTGKFKLWK